MVQFIPHRFRQTEVDQAQKSTRRGEHPDNGLFAKQGREGADPHFHLPRGALDTPLLRHVSPIGQELRQNLEPRDHIGRDPGRQECNSVQHPIDPPAQLQPVAAGLKMNIAGPDRLGLGQGPLDHIRRITRTGRIELSQSIGQSVRWHGAGAFFSRILQGRSSGWSGLFRSSKPSSAASAVAPRRDNRSGVDFPMAFHFLADGVGNLEAAFVAAERPFVRTDFRRRGTAVLGGLVDGLYLSACFRVWTRRGDSSAWTRFLGVSSENRSDDSLTAPRGQSDSSTPVESDRALCAERRAKGRLIARPSSPWGQGEKKAGPFRTWRGPKGHFDRRASPQRGQGLG